MEWGAPQSHSGMQAAQAFAIFNRWFPRFLCQKLLAVSCPSLMLLTSAEHGSMPSVTSICIAGLNKFIDNGNPLCLQTLQADSATQHFTFSVKALSWWEMVGKYLIYLFPVWGIMWDACATWPLMFHNGHYTPVVYNINQHFNVPSLSAFPSLTLWAGRKKYERMHIQLLIYCLVEKEA